MSSERIQENRPIFDILHLSLSFIQHTFQVKKIGVFGSFARGEERPDSDLDILVEFIPGQATFDNYMQLVSFLEETSSRHVDLVTESGINIYVRPYVEKETIWIEGWSSLDPIPDRISHLRE